MKIRRSVETVFIELPRREARALLDQLSSVRGGARLSKIRQVCLELEMALDLNVARRAENVGRSQ
jgi:hypothetical protein